MYHLVLRVGHLLHSHPGGSHQSGFVEILQSWIPTLAMRRRERMPVDGDDVADPGVGAEVEHPECLSGVDAQSPANPDEASSNDDGRWGPDDTWLSLP
jgi:hypothetical protein